MPLRSDRVHRGRRVRPAAGRSAARWRAPGPRTLVPWLMASARHVLDKARSVLLVDWPSPAVPRTLLEAGLVVYGFSPGGYSRAELAAEPPPPRDGVRSVPSETGELRHLVFRRLDRRPDQVDLVYVYRPAAELYGILVTHAVPLGATALWLHPPLSAAEGHLFARAGGPEIIEGCDIVAMIRALRSPR
jgi:hypothetical protein